MAETIVIAFRLDPEQERDAQILAYLAEQQRQGKTNRLTISEALLEMINHREDLASLQREALEILRRLESGSITIQAAQPAEQGSSELSDTFRAGLARIVRPVRRSE